MHVNDFLAALPCDFFAGVPDSQLRALCDALVDAYGTNPQHHIIAANEGNAVALAAGYHLATGKTACVYMQNSGEGNAINPIASLMSPDVYAIPAILVIGWRGEPGVKDEPQHVQQGRITIETLDVLGIPSFVLSPDTSKGELDSALAAFAKDLDEGRCVAIVVRKGALEGAKLPYRNDYQLSREAAIEHIAQAAGDDPIVSTTGKPSRELFEIRERLGQGHGRDFLSVGSMGHASSIAMGIAAQTPEQRVWCIDGDGSLLMHMGALALIGAGKIENIVHIVLNNAAHETVGGMPTAAESIDIPALAMACGYRSAARVASAEELDEALDALSQKPGPVLLEVKCAIGSRSDLGRPTSTPLQNKTDFIACLRG